MKTIIWDWNGTLLDDVAVCIECINALLRKNALPEFTDVEEYRRAFRFPVQDYYRACGFDFEKTPFELLAREFIDSYRKASEGCALAPSALGALEAARKRGFRQILLSASKHDDLLRQVGSYPLGHYFSEILGIGHIYATSKANLAAGWMERQPPDGRDVVMIGDSLHDYEVARSIGARCVLYTAGHQAISAEYRGHGAAVGDLRDAVALL
jgi:phosphoglycolate phosphatase